MTAQESSKKEITISKDLKWSERMALSIMKRDPKAWQIDNNEKPKWDYKLGLVTMSFQELYKKTKNRLSKNSTRNIAFGRCYNS